MSNDSPAAILIDSDGNDIALRDGDSIISALPIAGKDGSVGKIIKVDSNGQPVVVGAGIAGTPSGGVVSIQGVVGGQPIPISGTIEVDVVNTNDSVGLAGTTVPTNATLIGGSDGTNLRKIKVDTDGTLFVKVQEIQSTLLYDITDLVAYVGSAAVGSLPSQDVWTIKKTSFDVNGNPISQKTTAVASAIWDDRVIEVYN